MPPVAGRVIGRAGLEQSDDLAAAAAGALDDRVDPLLGRPAHLDEVGDRDAGDGRIFDHRHHRVAMAAEHEGGDVLDRDSELLGEEGAEAGAESSTPAMPTTIWCGRPRKFAQRPDHRVERVGDADHEGAGRVALDALADRLHHLQIDAEQVVAAHARLAGDAGGDDDHVGAGDVGIIVGALELASKPSTGPHCERSSALPCGTPSTTSNRTTSPKFLLRREMGERAADIAGADKRDLVASHGALPLSRS